MTAAFKSIQVSIQGREYSINCPASEEKSLMEAARFLEQKIQHFKPSTKNLSLENLLLMAAINLSHELLLSHKELEVSARQTKEQMLRLLGKVDTALDKIAAE
jgi:cell division protein ZapA